jgi:perosamine synthetase
MELETKFAAKFGAKYAIAANSGTSTLHMALEALGVDYGDEVISPALTVFMDTSCILHCNAIPVYADIDPKNWTIDPEDVRRKITSKTKAIIAVSLYGYPCDMEALQKVARDHSLPIIEDNAQHMGSHRADITSYSFERTKHLSCGEGGILLTNNEDWARKMRLLGNHGFVTSTAMEGKTKLNKATFQDPEFKRHCMVGWNYRLSSYQAEVAEEQLGKIDELVERRRQIAGMYEKVFEKYKGIFTPQQKHKEHTYWTYSVLLPTMLTRWREFRDMVLANGGDGFYAAWSVPYLEPVMSGGGFKKRCPPVYFDVDYKEGLCRQAERTQPHLMQFKTNYKTLEVAEEKIGILDWAIEQTFGRGN